MDSSLSLCPNNSSNLHSAWISRMLFHNHLAQGNSMHCLMICWSIFVSCWYTHSICHWVQHSWSIWCSSLLHHSYHLSNK
jgi:hypothetical protein